MLSESGCATNYGISCKTERNDGNTRWFDNITYKMDNSEFSDNDWEKLCFDMDEFYDKWRKEKLNNFMECINYNCSGFESYL